jgi:hypothetical protein
MRIPPPESNGELVFGDGPHNAFLGALEALLGQVEAGQLLLIWVALASSQSLTTAPVRTGMLSQYKNHSCSTITGLIS